MANNSIIQVYKNLENVNQDNMNIFYDTKDEQLNAYYPISPCIMSGIGSNKFGQVSTTNVFNLSAGNIRFINQAPVTITAEPKFTWVPLNAPLNLTLNGVTSGGGTFYCVAVLSQVALDNFSAQNTLTISTTALPAGGLDDQHVALFAITNTSGVYRVFQDNNCIHNYNNYWIVSIDFPKKLLSYNQGLYTISGVIDATFYQGIATDLALPFGGFPNQGISINATFQGLEIGSAGAISEIDFTSNDTFTVSATGAPDSETYSLYIIATGI